MAGESEKIGRQQQEQGSGNDELGGFHAGKGERGDSKKPCSSGESRQSWIREAQIPRQNMRVDCHFRYQSLVPKAIQCFGILDRHGPTVRRAAAQTSNKEVTDWPPWMRRIASPSSGAMPTA